MVAGNSGAYFIMDGAFRKELEEKRRAVEERGEQRLMKVQKQRETLRALLMGESDRSLSELRIVLLGKQKHRREVTELKDRQEERQGEIEDLRKKKEGQEEEISRLKEELGKLKKEKEESTAPVRNIVEMDLFMSGEKSRKE
ncbi:hypothetical protein AAFF_G00307730 [Aldrovandia affinis]|uniref:Uncharacterized protein n=1 Tax=Aldrovandia affinis TaxID=143900 RepID=A0AAD7W046_9TELE|nr:hypothetical protein AAFF_G00307730 [Aldrovandia affinis]